MSLPQPVTGPDRCHTCGGNRVMLIGSGKAMSYQDNNHMAVMFDDGSSLPYGWCATCRGEGTASVAMELLLLGTVMPK